MRKLYFVLLPVLFVFSSSYSQLQSPVAKITHSYFRSDPFETEFSAFLKHLLHDPTITNKIIEKKTDSSLFYFQGEYINYNPFFFKPVKVEVVLIETPVKLDSLRTDTIYSYQLLAYNNSTQKGIDEIKKEFEKIFRRYKGSFRKNSYTTNSSGGTINGATYNFFDGLHGLSPFAITWVGPNDDKQMCLILTIRMTTRNNKAALPVPFYAF